MQGVNLNDKEEKEKPVKKKEILNDGFVFRDLSEYEGLTQEEKNNLTEKMKGNHKRWANENQVKGLVAEE